MLMISVAFAFEEHLQSLEQNQLRASEMFSKLRFTYPFQRANFVILLESLVAPNPEIVGVTGFRRQLDVFCHRLSDELCVKDGRGCCDADVLRVLGKLSSDTDTQRFSMAVFRCEQACVTHSSVPKQVVPLSAEHAAIYHGTRGQCVRIGCLCVCRCIDMTTVHFRGGLVRLVSG